MKKNARQPTNIDIIQMKALSKIGHNPNQIGKALKWDRKTVVKYLQKELSPDEQREVDHLVVCIRETELKDLTLIGAKARAHLHKLLDEGKMKAIETVATIDRTFQQRRLLEGKSTSNIDILQVVEKCEKLLKNIKKEEQELKAELIEAGIDPDELDLTADGS